MNCYIQMRFNSVAVEAAGFATLVAIVSLLAVGIIGDDEGVLVFGTAWMDSDLGADIFATIMDLWHGVLL